MTFGQTLKKARESQGLLLRQVAARLEVDTATVSKIENGLRHATKKQIKALSTILKIEYRDLEASWMGNKIYQMLQDIDDPNQALLVAEEHVLYNSQTQEK
ncbi:MAG: helix-turn-helix transcriptional regulator [Bacteroidota bacterium]